MSAPTQVTKLMVLTDAGAVDARELQPLAPGSTREHLQQQAHRAAELNPRLAERARGFVRHDPIGARKTARAEIRAMLAERRGFDRDMRAAERSIEPPRPGRGGR